MNDPEDLVRAVDPATFPLKARARLRSLRVRVPRRQLLDAQPPERGSRRRTRRGGRSRPTRPHEEIAVIDPGPARRALGGARERAARRRRASLARILLKSNEQAVMERVVYGVRNTVARRRRK